MELFYIMYVVQVKTDMFKLAIVN